MKRLEPTYEGLKHRPRARGRRIMSGLEPTYEGLKPTASTRRSTRASSLEPTYEGLKPHSSGYYISERVVWSLPMRD